MNFEFGTQSLNYSLRNRGEGGLRKINVKGDTEISGNAREMFAFLDTRKLNIIADANEEPLIIRTTNCGRAHDTFGSIHFSAATMHRETSRVEFTSGREGITGNTDRKGRSLLEDE